MVFRDQLSLANVGAVGPAAIAEWIQGNLSEMFDTVLHEPLPQPLLAILDAGTKANTASKAVQNEFGRVRS